MEARSDVEAHGGVGRGYQGRRAGAVAQKHVVGDSSPEGRGAGGSDREVGERDGEIGGPHRREHRRRRRRS